MLTHFIKSLRRANFKSSQKSHSTSLVMMTPISHMQKSRNYLIIVYLVKKFIQNLKTCLSVKRLLRVKQFHLNVLNDSSSFYKDGKDLAKPHIHIKPNLIKLTGEKLPSYNYVDSLSLNLKFKF